MGTADFFFLNPNGIVFGSNAQLNIGGSFIGSTAESLQIEDGTEFSINDTNPLLTISVPTGLQFGAGAGNIRVLGEGNGLFLNPDSTVNGSNRPTGLDIPSGHTLALVGGNLTLNGGNLTADIGHIDLGAVDDNSFVLLTANSTGWELDYTEVETFGNIQFLNAASTDVSGNNAGVISLQGRTITLQDGSSLLAKIAVSGGGTITVEATESLQMTGTSATTPAAPFTALPTSAYIEIAPVAPN
ncbi:MAG: filamentous hemagglutinin N-terminal domain-containing protein [Cyanobacteria bacterium P01_F01_bin.150]